MMEMEDGRCLRADVSGPRTESGKGQGRDTRMCGDPKMWFPMRVTYQREMKVKAELDRLGIENFVPMRYKVVERHNNGDTELRRVLVPAINNLIFVRSTQERVSELKRTNEVLEPLRYMMDHTAAREHAIMTVADGEMENFMRVASRTDDSVMFLDDETVLGKEGKRVEIMGGAFEGVTGVIRRVKRCKRVVVEIEGVASVAIAWVPAGMLKEIG
ncbi:UpxY family transcription antiterminator [uncultured Prevotella sp.]|uniref:UpxY family transcription antiterminator n=1 Tax=uncultured Prevotella sp. TaxID=159272 RepID=UPI0025E1145D|nr:UpxY family transcription antiterminator [uncultured Prevotella sp.]